MSWPFEYEMKGQIAAGIQAQEFTGMYGLL